MTKREHQSHCSCFYQVGMQSREVERLTAALRHIQEVAEEAAQGKSRVDHWWYGEEVHRALDHSVKVKS